MMLKKPHLVFVRNNFLSTFVEKQNNKRQKIQLTCTQQ